MKLILLTVLLTMCSTGAFSQKRESLNLEMIDKQAIPEDTMVRRGVLDNGLTYYVRKNDSPKKLAYFYLLVKAGSVVEQDNERGIAHFVEHMQFKGTKHFPGSIFQFTQRHGLQFGHDTNAFTGFTTVRYQLNGIPVDDAVLMDSCLLLLRDWAGDATIAAKDVESEHNVIVEEWRTRMMPSFVQQLQNDFYNNSIYARRSPIGDMDIVKNCTQQLVRNFYDRWYQPQNQAVVLVGDFDADEMVMKVKRMFGDRKRGKTVSPAVPAIPDSETKYLLYTEKQQPFASLCYLLRLAGDTAKHHTVGSMKTDVVRDEIRMAMEMKLKSLRAKYPELIDGSVMSVNVGDLSDKLWVLNLSAPQDQWRHTLELLAMQVELIRRKGFGDDYWKQRKNYIWPDYNADSTAIVFVDTVYAKHPNSLGSTQHVEKCLAHFFNGDAIIPDMERHLVDRHLRNTITADDLRKEFCRMTSGRNMMIGVMLPDSAMMPGREEVETVCQRVKQMSDEELAEIEAVQQKKLDRINVEDLDITTVPGTVVKTKVLNDSISEVLLSNGVKVVLMKQKTEHNQVNFMLRRPQGYSMLADDDINFHGMLGSCLRKFSCFNGQSNVVVEAFDDTYDHMAKWEPGDSLNLDRVECTLKMLYKSLTTDEIDSVEFAEQKQKLQTSVASLSTPLAQSALKVGMMILKDTRRQVTPSAETIANYDIGHFREVVREYFSNFNGAVMVVQGEYDTDSIMPLILKYVGALPSKPERVKRTVWPSDHYKTENSVMTEKIETPAPICQTFLFYTWEKGYKYTQQTHAHNEVLKSVLANQLFQTLRVQHSDVYTPQIQMEDALLPVPKMRYVISYACDPTQRERIAEDVKRIVRDMAEGNLITQDMIDSYVKSREKVQDAYKGNEYTRRRDYLTQELNGIVVNQGDLTYIRQVTPKSLKAFVKQLLKKGNLHVGYLTSE